MPVVCLFSPVHVCFAILKTMLIDRSFYRQDSVSLAKALLGRRLVRLYRPPDSTSKSAHAIRLAGVIVETEAYLGVSDLAAHTAGGRRTPRNEAMYNDGGHLYVYFTYGMHYCCNVVAGGVDEPVAVLIRALEPVEGLDVMYQHRTKARKDTDLCSGPAKLCQALAINRNNNHCDLLAADADIFIEETDLGRSTITSSTMAGPRIGVDYAKEWASKPLRFFLKDNPHVSRK